MNSLFKYDIFPLDYTATRQYVMYLQIVVLFFVVILP